MSRATISAATSAPSTTAMDASATELQLPGPWFPGFLIPHHLLLVACVAGLAEHAWKHNLRLNGPGRFRGLVCRHGKPWGRSRICKRCVREVVRHWYYKVYEPCQLEVTERRERGRSGSAR